MHREAEAIKAAVFALMASIALCTAHAADPSQLAPPVNHESGHIKSVVSAADQGFRYTAYLVDWRNSRIVVSDRSAVHRQPGDTLDFIVYRRQTSQGNILRFDCESAEPGADEDDDSSSAAITLGTAKIEEVLNIESDGYRFRGYFVSWHDQRVFVPDPGASALKAVGDTLNFRVLRTSQGTNKVLSFSSP